MARFADLAATLGMLAHALWFALRGLLRRLLWSAGAILIVACVLAFTRLPYDAHRWLGMAGGECLSAPRHVVVLGGSGMPSGPELLRLHRAADAAREWPSARLLVVHPGDPAVLQAMVQELVLRGVEPARIDTANAGDNTREQALLVRARIREGRVAIVTAPENTWRSVLAFRKVGMGEVCGLPAWDHAMFHEFRYGHAAIGGKAWAPDVSERTALRYTFWNYLKLEVTCLREYAAMAYYWINGWV